MRPDMPVAQDPAVEAAPTATTPLATPAVPQASLSSTAPTTPVSASTALPHEVPARVIPSFAPTPPPAPAAAPSEPAAPTPQNSPTVEDMAAPAPVINPAPVAQPATVFNPGESTPAEPQVPATPSTVPNPSEETPAVEPVKPAASFDSPAAASSSMALPEAMSLDGSLPVDEPANGAAGFSYNSSPQQPPQTPVTNSRSWSVPFTPRSGKQAIGTMAAIVLLVGAALLLNNHFGKTPAVTQQANLSGTGTTVIQNVKNQTLHFNTNTFIDNGSSFNTTGSVLFKNQTDSTSAFVVQDASGSSLVTVDTTKGTVTINGLQGSGAELTNLNASNLTSGTVPLARLPASLAIQGNPVNGPNGLVELDSAGNLPALNAGALTNLNANNITSGTLSNSRLSPSVTVQGNTFNGIAELVQLDSSGHLPVLNAQNLTNINAGNVSSGTLSDSRLSTNVALLNANQTFTGHNIFQSSSNSTAAFQIQNSAGNDSLLIADTTNNRIGIDVAVPLFALDVGGDVNVASGSVYRIGGSVVCSVNGCAAASGSGNYVQIQLSTPGTVQTGNANISGTFIAANFAGSGLGLTNLDASQVASGTLDSARLNNLVVTLQGNSFNGANELVQTTAASYLPALNGSLVTNLNASNLASGQVADGLLSTNVAFLNASSQTFTGSNVFSSSIAAPGLHTTNSGHTISLGFTGTATGTVNYNLDVAATPGTYNICTSAGNCTSGITTTGGVVNQLAKFSGSQSITNSIISDDGTTVTIAGNLAANNITQNGQNVCDASGNCVGTGGGGSIGGSGTAGTIALFTGSGFTIANSALTQASGNVTLASGELGLGATPAGSAKLEINAGGAGAILIGNGDTIEAKNTSGSVGAILGVSATDNSINLGASSYFPQLNLWSNGSQALTINSSQQVGIGITTGIAAKLQVVGTGLFQSTGMTAFQVQKADGSGNSLIVDTSNTRVGIGKVPAYTLDVAGDVNVSSGFGFKIGGTYICDPITITCAPSAGSPNYIQNGVALQTSANFNIQSTSTGSVVGVLQGKSGQTADLLDVIDGSSNTVASIGNKGQTLFKDSSSGSTTFFQVQNSTGGSLINVDSANSAITLDGNDSGQLGSWTTNSNALPTTSEFATSVTANGYAYLIGGLTTNNVTTSQSTVYYAKLNADGSTGTWTTNTNALPANRYAATSVTANGYIYEIGGYFRSGSSVPQSTVYYAKLNADGSTGTWTTNTNALPATSFQATSVTANGYVYVMNSSGTSTVYYAKLNADGSTGTWSTNAHALPSSNVVTSVVANGYVYAMGGTAVYYAKLNADGSTGTWTTGLNAIPSSISPTSAVTNGYIYAMANNTTAVYYAKLNTDGSTGTWNTNANPLPAIRQQSTSITANGYVYELGGDNTSGGTSTVYYASTARLQVGANLDLVGLQSGDGTAGGSLTANNGTFAGNLQVNGAGSFAQGLNVVGPVAIQAGKSDSTSVFSIQNSSGTNLLTVDTSDSNIGLGQLTTGALGAWSTNANTLPQVLDGSASVTANGYVYEMGGITTGGTVQSTVYYAKLNADGSTSTWTTNSNALPSTRVVATSVTANGYVYVIGGFDNSVTYQSTVYYAKLNADGSTGAWQCQGTSTPCNTTPVNTNSLPQALQASSSVVANGYVYVMGGNNSGGTTQSTVYYAKLNADGSTGAWATSPNILLQTLRNASSVTANGYVYVMGGNNGSTYQSTVYYAKLNTDGSIGAWSTNSNALPNILAQGTAVVANNYVYYMAGGNSGGGASTVYYAKLNANGSTGTWATNTNALPQTLTLATSVMYNGYIYELGGNNPPNIQSTVYYASVQGMTRNSGQESIADQLTVGNSLTVAGNTTFQPTADSTSAFSLQNSTGGSLINVDSTNSVITLDGNDSGQLGYWYTASNALLGTRTPQSFATTANGYAYIIQGTATEYAKLNADGSTGAWATSPNSLPATLSNGVAVVNNGYIYAVAGCVSGCSTSASTVYYAKLNSDGTTGVWQTNTNPLPQALDEQTTVVANGYIYAIGGRNVNTVLATVYYAKLNADGSTGVWTTSGNSLPQSIYAQTSVVANGYVYVMGGETTSNNNTTAQSTVYYAKLNSDGSVGAWSTNTNALPATRTAGSSVYSNGYIYFMGGEDNTSTAQSTVYYAKLNSDGSVGAWSTNTNALPLARWQAGSIAFNGYVYMMGGFNQGGTAQSTVYYASTARLQVGANLDLIGAQGGDGTAGGSLTANNGYFAGNFQVQGNANFAQGVGINGNLTTNGSALFQNSTNSTNAFQIQNAAGNQAINVNTGTTPNLIANGDFESTINGWKGKGSATILRNDTSAIGAASGVGSLAITTTAAANDGATYAYTFAASTTYTLSLYARSSSGTASTINIGRQEVSGTDIDCLTAQTISTSWTRYTCTFTTGATITLPNSIYIKQSDATVRTFYIDGVQLEQASSASAFQANQANLQIQTATNVVSLDGSDSGALGPWSTNTNSLPQILQLSTSVTANGYVYEIGGDGSGTGCTGSYCANVYYAKLNADGSTGSWTTNTNSLPAGRFGATSITANGYVYVMGGNGSVGCYPSNTCANVYYAKLNTDGSTGAWINSTSALPYPINSATSVTANGYVYVMGGSSNSSPYNFSTVYYAKLNSDGSLGSWQTSANALPDYRSLSTSVVANGYVYIMGGRNSAGTAEATIYYAQLNSNGSTGVWQCEGTSTPCNTTPINGNALPAVRDAMPTSVVSNGYVYVMGGVNITNQSTVYYAKLNSDGSTGSWSTNSNALPQGLSDATSVTANGYVYEIGGGTSSSPFSSSTVYYASTARIQIGASIDLVGLQGGDLSDPGDQSTGSVGGSITAGNGIFVGTLQVQGAGSFAQGVSVGGNLTTSGSALFQSATGLSNAFQIENAAGQQAVNVNTTTTPNLIANGDFESTTNGWTGKGSATIARNDTTAIGAASGVGSLAITTTAAANDGAYYGYGFTASTQYTFSLYARSSSGTLSTINIGYNDTGSDQNCLVAQTVYTTWTRYTCTFTSDSSITSTPPYVYIKQSDATSRTFYIDAVQLEQSSTASAFQSNQANLQIQTATNVVSLDGSDSGALGPWNTNANSTPTALQSGNAVTANGYIYYMGGSNSGGVSQNVSYAQLNADGSTGTWNSANNLPQQRYWGAGTVANGYIYQLGGYSAGSVAQSTVYYARLNANGTLGTWQTGISLPATLLQGSATVSNGYIYVTAGASNNAVYYAKLNADGSTGAWQTNANSTPNNVGYTFVVNGFIYSFPYVSGSCSSMYYAQINTTNGSIGSWTTLSGAPSSCGQPTVSNGYVYVPGTSSNTGAYYAKINTDGTLGAWKTNSYSLPQPVGQGASSVTANGYIYVINGYNGSSYLKTVYYASTARIQVGGNIDLVGLQGGGLGSADDQSSGSVGGSITAGNGMFVGNLQVQGSGSFSQGLAVNGNLVASGSSLFQNSSGSSNAFQIENAAGQQAVNVNTTTTPNLIANGDFESTTNGWTGKGSATIARNDTTAIGAASGVGSLKITTTAAANDGASFNYTFAPTTQYTLSLYAYSASSISTINIGRQDVSGTDVNCLTAQTVSNSWTRYSCTFTTGSTITPPSSIYIKQSDATARTFYIDGVQLEKAAAASGFQGNQANLQIQTATNTISLDGSDSGALGPWSTNATVLSSANAYATSVTANGYVYEIGGNTIGAGGPVSTVWYAKLNADGSVGSWTTNANSLPQVMDFANSVAANGYVYVIGGAVSGVAQSTVYYAKLNADGSTGVWQTSTNGLPAGRFDPTSVVANGYVYVMGGGNTTAGTGCDVTWQLCNNVWYAKLNADGSTGAWTTGSNSLPAQLNNATSVVANGYVYVMGGQTVGGVFVATVYYAKLNADGSTGAWTTSANAMPDADAYATSVTANGYVYEIGGVDNSINLSAVFYAKLNADGSTGAWGTSATPLPAVRRNATSVTANGYIYEMGGFNNSSVRQSTIFYASTARIQIGASIDLVGLQGGDLSDPGDQSTGSVGGSITAGNGIFVGSLQVQGAASFAQSISDAGTLSVGGDVAFQSTTNSATAFQIQNSSGTSILTADTSTGGGVITLGAASSTPTILVLGVKNTLGDPTCTTGAVYYNSNNNLFRGCSNGTWITLGPSELGYAQYTSQVSVTATTEATANTIVTAPAITFDGSTPVMLNFFSSYVQLGSSQVMNFAIYDGSSSIGLLSDIYCTSTQCNIPENGSYRFTPSSGSHTYSIRAYVTGGTGYVTAGSAGAGNNTPGYIRISVAQ